MTVQFTAGVRYRTPAVFGPAPGPRQKADGSPWSVAETGTMRADWFAVSYRTDPEALEELLPSGFELRGDPVVALNMSYFHDLYWLAGGGYGIVRVEFPVTYHGRTETIEGTFCPVMWEGHPDAIITGRDELGFPKLFADIAPLDVDIELGHVSGSASWLGHTFVEAAIDGLVEVDAGRDRSMPGADGPTLQLKYVPRVAPDGSIGADIAYVTTSAPRPGERGSGDAIDLGGTAFRRWTGSGSLAWRTATFEQQPVTYHVVNGMAAVPVREVVKAELVSFTAPGALISATAVRAVEPLDVS